MLKTSDFDFNLPENLVAQQPFFPKEETKMLVFDGARILDSQLINLANFLQEGDVMVFNVWNGGDSCGNKIITAGLL